jgi:hypothetical protein
MTPLLSHFPLLAEVQIGKLGNPLQDAKHPGSTDGLLSAAAYVFALFCLMRGTYHAG